jgi:hypothetical protein
VGTIFTFGSDISYWSVVLPWPVFRPGAVCAWLVALSLRELVAGGFALPGGDRGDGCRGGVRGRGWLWRRGEAGEGLAAALAGFRRQAGCGAAGVLFLACVPCCEDALVADDELGGGEQRQGRQSREAAPAAADVVGGGVLGGGEAAFGAGAAGVGAVPGGGGVVVFLRGFSVGLGRDGEGLLGAAGLGVFGGLEDLGPVPVPGH